MKRIFVSVTTVLLLACTSADAETVCPAPLITAHLEQQLNFFEQGSAEDLVKFANSLSEAETEIEGRSPADDFFCYSVFDRLSLGTFTLSAISLESSTVDEKLMALSFLDENRRNYQILLRDFVARGDGGDQIALTLQKLVENINDSASAILNNHSTTEILAFDRRHGDKPVYRVVFGAPEKIMILEVSFDPDLLITTFEVPTVRSFWPTEDGIRLEYMGTEDRWREWASAQGIKVEFGAAENMLHFSDGGYELPLSWRSQSDNHDNRRAAVTSLREALFEFIEPVRSDYSGQGVQQSQEIKDAEHGSQSHDRNLLIPNLFAGDCVEYLGSEEVLAVYAAPDARASYRLLGSATRKMAFTTAADGIVTPTAQSRIDMSIELGGVTLFEGQVATSWLEVEFPDDNKSTGFVVFSRSAAPDAKAEVLFRRVVCE